MKRLALLMPLLAACTATSPAPGQLCDPPTVRCWQLQLDDGSTRMVCADGNHIKLADSPFTRRT